MSGAEVVVENGRVRLKIWDGKKDEFVILSFEQIEKLYRQIDACMDEIIEARHREHS